MNSKVKHKLLNYFIATVWIANGLFCKVLNLVPRHQQIVARILGDDYSRLLTLLIGLSEIGMTNMDIKWHQNAVEWGNANSRHSCNEHFRVYACA